jgi:hypothetical protein
MGTLLQVRLAETMVITDLFTTANKKTAVAVFFIEATARLQ